ncbi:Flp family type IVb pilin [Pseudomonas sp. PDM18]|uniref:Flp family type IVb pilin n=1 Tax=Pseudomonas sp. PDM18 TaxID=2769253 RepID=UPI00177B8388|nr:Flp family type IVb pilin [Pseudomonas sp. PDM18]MBD9676669.1 Flp family type IVb pilin [Pseudomonas sp. PDM18]
MKNLSLKLYCKAKAFTAEKEGATAIEYAVIAGLIAVAIVGAAKILGTDISAVFTKVSTEIK